MIITTGLIRVKSLTRLVGAFLGLTALHLSAAMASIIPVPNHSFESPTTPTGNYSGTKPDDWTKRNTSGTYHEPASGGLQVPDGVQAGWAGPSDSAVNSLWQELTTAVIPGGIYKLTVDVGQQAISSTSTALYDYGFRLGYVNPRSTTPITSAVFFASYFTNNDGTTGSIMAGTFKDDLSVTGTASISAPATDDLIIELYADNNNGKSRAVFDDVRVDLVPVPEPSTFAVLGFGLVGLGGLVARRRLRAPNKAAITAHLRTKPLNC